MSCIEIMEKKIQISLRLRKELLKRAKKFAIDNDTSVDALVAEALKSYISDET